MPLSYSISISAHHFSAFAIYAWSILEGSQDADGHRYVPALSGQGSAAGGDVEELTLQALDESLRALLQSDLAPGIARLRLGADLIERLRRADVEGSPTMPRVLNSLRYLRKSGFRTCVESLETAQDLKVLPDAYARVTYDEDLRYRPANEVRVERIAARRLRWAARGHV